VKERTPRGGLFTIQDALQSFLKEAGITRSHGIVVAVFRAWETVVGREFTKLARPVRFQRGELTVEVATSSLLFELATFASEDHRQRVNEVLGRELVHRMIFKQRG
jgi:hypothetical protein